MPQFRLRPSDLRGDRFTLSGDEAHHVVRVFRAEPGTEIDLFDGNGGRYRGVVETIDGASPAVSGRVIAVRETVVLPRLRLLQGLPKGAKFDFVIEKAVELGASAIFPFLGETSPVGVGAERAAAKIERWKRVAEAAAKQCGATALPDITAPRPLRDYQSELHKGRFFVLDERGTPLKADLQAAPIAVSPPNSGNIGLVVGPESGFSRGEMEWLTALGARVVSVGPTTLRTETAGLVGLALLRHELSDLSINK